jgi:hypothetical protein
MTSAVFRPAYLQVWEKETSIQKKWRLYFFNGGAIAYDGEASPTPGDATTSSTHLTDSFALFWKNSCIFIRRQTIFETPIAVFLITNT